jgi:hypothetical protein
MYHLLRGQPCLHLLVCREMKREHREWDDVEYWASEELDNVKWWKHSV